MNLGAIEIDGKKYEAYTTDNYIMLLDCEAGESTEYDSLSDLLKTIETLQAYAANDVQAKYEAESRDHDENYLKRGHHHRDCGIYCDGRCTCGLLMYQAGQRSIFHP